VPPAELTNSAATNSSCQGAETPAEKTRDTAMKSDLKVRRRRRHVFSPC